MPIKGLTGQVSVPVAGHFRLGLMVPGKDQGVMRPQAVDYFVFRPTALLHRVERLREEAAREKGRPQEAALLKEAAAAELEVKAAADAFSATHGAEPRELVVRFLSEDLDKTFSHWYTLWGGKRLLCKGDGETVRWRGVEEDSGVDEEGRLMCPGPESCPLSVSRANKDGVPACGPSGSLRFTLDDLAGIYSLELGNWRAVKRALACLEALRGSVGGLCGYPVRLSLRPERQKGRDGKERTVQVVDITPAVAAGEARASVGRVATVPAHVEIEAEDVVVEDEPVDPDFAVPDDGAQPPAWWEADGELQDALAGATPLKRAAIVKALETGTLDRDGAMKAAMGRR